MATSTTKQCPVTPLKTIETKPSQAAFIAAIKQLQTGIAEDRLAGIRKHVGIGALLAEWKKHTDHGQWMQTVEKVGYNRQTARRLIRLCNSPLASEIGTRGIDLVERLPVDIQKLTTLARLPKDKLTTALESGVVFDRVSRGRLRTAVKHLKDSGEWLLSKHSPVAAEPDCQASKVPDRQDPEPNPTGTGWNGRPYRPEAAASERDDQKAHPPESATAGISHQTQIARFTRLMDENNRHEHDKPIRAQVEEGFRDFVGDVLDVARKHGRRLCNVACRAVGGDGELLAMTLLGLLQKENLKDLFVTEGAHDD